MDISPSNLVAFDFETHLIQPGLLAPPGVCGSFAFADALAFDGSEPTRLLQFDTSLNLLRELLQSDAVLAVANGAYDWAVACAEATGGRFKGDPSMLPLVFDKYERGEVFDVLIGVALDAVADGMLFKDPENSGPLRQPGKDGKPGKVSNRYSLEITSRLVLGRHNAKENDEYRLRYAELEHTPIDQWPEVARQYPIDDAVNTLDVASALVLGSDNRPMSVRRQVHNQGLIDGKTWTHHTHQARAAFAMHLACCWGLRTDPLAVEVLAKKTEYERQRALGRFVEAGLLKPNGSKDTCAIKRRVIEAYGGGKKCEPCSGSGKVASEKNPKSKINCKPCGGSGLVVPDSVPSTATGGVAADRDTLAESGDELLEAFAEASKIDKIADTYIPFLRTGVDRPINVRANVLVESGRASYDGLIQLIPRGGGIRECFVFRDGYVGCSVDYAALELCTLAQVCLWTVGESAMARAINDAGDPGILHTLFGASLVGVDPDEFIKRVKAGDKVAKNQRQMAKAANFGFPGLMGAAKFVLAKRKEGLRLCIASGSADHCQDCKGELGRVECRRCHGRGSLCGTEKVTEWNGRPIAPTCSACLITAEELRRSWFEQWPEIKEYFKWVKSHDGIEDGIGQVVSPGTGYVRGGLNASSLANHSFQHLAAMGAKHALWKVSKECYTYMSSPLYGSRIQIFAHDELISELVETNAHDAAYRKSAIMVAAMREFVPDVTIKAEPALMRRWYKDAEAVFDQNGRLIPWEQKKK